MADKKKKKTGIGLAAWLLVAIVLLIIFLVKWETIHNNLVKAGVIQGDLIVKEEKPEKTTEKSADKTDKKSDKKDNTITLKVQEDKPSNVKSDNKPSNQNSTDTTKSETKPVDQTQSSDNKSTEKIANTPSEKSATNTETKSAPEKTETKPAPKPVAKTDLKLCFILIDADGTLNYKIVTRSVNKNDSPLTTAINLVLAGPSMSLAAEKDCTSLIPSGTKLLGASVSNGVATLNFNEAFEINPDGFEGYIAQLKQIIFTATQFDSVKSVQFLIEGKKIEYLGSEGVWIGTPLSRTSF